MTREKPLLHRLLLPALALAVTCLLGACVFRPYPRQDGGYRGGNVGYDPGHGGYQRGPGDERR